MNINKQKDKKTIIIIIKQLKNEHPKDNQKKKTPNLLIKVQNLLSVVQFDRFFFRRFCRLKNVVTKCGFW